MSKKLQGKQSSTWGELVGSVGGAAWRKGVLEPKFGTQWAPGSGSRYPHLGEWEMHPWERLHYTFDFFFTQAQIMWWVPFLNVYLCLCLTGSLILPK